MLRITVHEDSREWRMKLEGRLAGEWVGEAEKVWNAADTAGKRLEVDMNGVTAIDTAGWNLLRAMKHAGARCSAQGVATKTRLHELVMVFVLLLALLPNRLSAQDQPMKLTLKEAVNIALKQNPQVAIANLNLIQSQQVSRESRSALLPQGSFAASENVTRENVAALFGRRVPIFPGHVGPFWATEAGAQVSTPLFDLTAWNRWKASREDIRASAAKQTSARELNVQLVVSQYLGGLRASADVEAAKSRMDLAKALLDLASDLQKNGVGTGIDTLRANVEFQNESQRYTEAATQLKIYLFGLSRLLNLDPNQNIELADTPSFFETPAFSSDESLNKAFETRPEMKTVLSQIRSAELQQRAARDQRVPKLSVGGQWNLQGLTPTTMIPVYQFGASVQVPLFTSGRIEAQTAAAGIEIKKLEQTERDVRNQIALEVKTASAQLQSARVEVDAANLGVSLAKESVRQSQDRFRAGVANNIEVITAQNDLARANDNQIAALYRYNQARADLGHATGQMEALYTK